MYLSDTPTVGKKINENSYFHNAVERDRLARNLVTISHVNLSPPQMKQCDPTGCEAQRNEKLTTLIGLLNRPSSQPRPCCYRTALLQDIQNQYIFDYGKCYYGIIIQDLKSKFYNNQTAFLSQGDSAVNLAHIGAKSLSNKKGKKPSTKERKIHIIQEICRENISVCEGAKRYNVATTSIYRWCKAIYNLKMKEYRLQQQQTCPEIEGLSRSRLAPVLF